MARPRGTLRTRTEYGSDIEAHGAEIDRCNQRGGWMLSIVEKLYNSCQ